MAMSGVKLTEGCMIAYQDIQKSKKHRYAIFVIQAGMIEVETVSGKDAGRAWPVGGWRGMIARYRSKTVSSQVGNRGNSYADFLTDLHKQDGEADDCRYGVYDYDYQFNPDGAESTFKSKIFLMSWCPDSSKIKKKMLYSSSFDTLKRGVCCTVRTVDNVECSTISTFCSFCRCAQGDPGQRQERV
jgi:cofilin